MLQGCCCAVNRVVTPGQLNSKYSALSPTGEKCASNTALVAKRECKRPKLKHMLSLLSVSHQAHAGRSPRCSTAQRARLGQPAAACAGAPKQTGMRCSAERPAALAARPRAHCSAAGGPVTAAPRQQGVASALLCLRDMYTKQVPDTSVSLTLCLSICAATSLAVDGVLSVPTNSKHT